MASRRPRIAERLSSSSRTSMCEPEKRKRQSAIWIRSPSRRRTGPVGVRPLICVPPALARSSRKKPLGRRTIRACSRDTLIVRRTMLQAESRPRVVASRSSSNDRQRVSPLDHLQAGLGGMLGGHVALPLTTRRYDPSRPKPRVSSAHFSSVRVLPDKGRHNSRVRGLSGHSRSGRPARPRSSMQGTPRRPRPAW